MTGADYLNEDLKRREEKKKSKQDASVKGDKLLTISARIAEHDLASKIQNVLKWLNKSYEVRIVVTGDGAGNKAKQEDIAQRFEASVKDAGKIVQKRLRDNDLRFNILPTAGGSAVGGGKKGLLDVKDATNGLSETQAARGLHTRSGSNA
uniref:Translation initiation factor 3 N-terminal domain-containing protein n=1 Tax=Anopheles epiroticus TaxID=199890 RepID=A0A182PBT1_9DIPT